MDDPAVANELVETTVRVATWNLWWQFGGNWQARLPLIIAELRRVDADVVALQEVWSTEETSSAHLIAEALGVEAVGAATIEFAGGVSFGNAVLSRWPVAGSSFEVLPDLGCTEGRIVQRVDVDGPRGALQVFNTHLNWRLDQSHVRQAQVRAIAEQVAGAGPRTFPPILCGDFNAEPHSVEIELLTGQREVAVPGLVMVDAWHAVHPTDPGFTFRNANPYAGSQLEWDRRLDYVFVGWPKAGGRGHPVRAERIGTTPTDGVWPSDHDGVVVELRY